MGFPIPDYIVPGAVVKLTSGVKCRIYATDGVDGRPIHGAVETAIGWHACTLMASEIAGVWTDPLKFALKVGGKYKTNMGDKMEVIYTSFAQPDGKMAALAKYTINGKHGYDVIYTYDMDGKNIDRPGNKPLFSGYDIIDYWSDL